MSIRASPAVIREDFNIDGRYNLMSAPRLENYRGFYFVNFNKDAISLEAYLAGAKEIIDLIMDQTEVGHTLIGRPHEYTIDANYKYLAENSYDGYHAPETHRTYFEFLSDRLRASGGGFAVTAMMGDYPGGGRGAGLGMGHGYFEAWVPNGKPVASWIPPWGTGSKSRDRSHSRSHHRRISDRSGPSASAIIRRIRSSSQILSSTTTSRLPCACSSRSRSTRCA